MRIRPVVALALFGLVLFPAAARPDDAKNAEAPTFIVRLRSLDGLLADLKYLAALGGQEEQVKQVEAMLKGRAGEKGLEGFDTKRPIGLYGYAGPNGQDSTAVGLIPVKDEKAVLDLLERLNLKAEKGEGGLYTVTPENSPVPFYFRFVNKYAYVTARDEAAIAPGKLLKPEQVFGDGHHGLLSATFRIDRIPDGLKEIAAGQAGLRLAELRERQAEKESKVQKAFTGQVYKETNAQLKTLLNDGRELNLKLNVDRKSGDLTAEFSLDAKPGSKLAEGFAAMGEATSLFGGLAGKNSAVSFVLHYALTERLQKALGPVVDDAIRDAVKQESDPTKKALTEKMLKVLAPTLKAGEIDAAVELRGPSPKKLYTAVAGIKLRNGEQVEQAVKDLIRDLPEEQRAVIKLNAAKADGVSIHKVEVGNLLDDEARALFGDGPAYFAVRSDALLVAMGEHAQGALKTALSAPPQKSPVVKVELSMARLAALQARDNKDAPEIAKKVFGDNKDADKVIVVVEGGKALRARVSMKALVIKYVHMLDQAKKGEADQ